MKKIKAAVLGCTGLVGRQFIRLLENHPFFTLACLTASSRSAGKRYGETLAVDPAETGSEKTARMIIGETTAAAVIRSGARVVFSALPAAVSGKLEAELRAAGLFVFSNAGARRLDADVPLLIPEVNAGHLRLVDRQLRQHPGFIVTNPNCVVAGLALALKPLMAFSPRSVTVTTFQAVSGGGRSGVAAWDILGNVVPHIADEEEKVVRETKKILGALSASRVADCPLEIYPSCSRVPVREGHLQSVTVEFPEPADEDALAAALAAYKAEPQELGLPTAPQRPIVVRREANRPQPLLDVHAGTPGRARGMAVSVGRLRTAGNRFSFYLLVHNTVRGAAGGSVLNAELAVRKKRLPGVTHE